MRASRLRLHPARVVWFGLFGASCFACGAAIGTGRAGAGEHASPFGAVAQLGRVLVQIENNYVDPVDRARLVEGAIKGMVAELDPHSTYMQKDEWRAFQNDTEGKFGGIGVEVDLRDADIKVIAPIEGSPAERAGIKSGDVIVQIDGHDVERGRFEKSLTSMRGDPGTKVKLTVRREREVLFFELTREIVKVKSVTYKLMKNGVGYVRLRQFQEGTHAEFVAAAKRLETEAREAQTPLRGILLDVRSNPGGLVDEATGVADEFLGSGTIFTLRRRGATVEEQSASRGGVFADLAVVAAVNAYSASAAELLIGALQDNKRATVVGVNTFGKGSVQSIIELPEGTGLKLTTARYFTPSGHAIQADGIHPDIRVSPADGAKSPFEQRERDLDNHLAPEGPSGGSPRSQPDAGALLVAPLDAGIEYVELARNVPADPRSSGDFILKTSYEELLKRMGAGGAK